MVRPAQFRSNEQTAVNNYFQSTVNSSVESVLSNALKEFDNFVIKLQSVGVNVLVIQDTEDTDTPDAVFPNNWISFHSDGTVCLYPMFAVNRRIERRPDIFDIVRTNGFTVTKTVDYSEFEDKSKFLEGTGSLILDRVNKVAYCALSARSDSELLAKFCNDFNYKCVAFTAYQSAGGDRLVIYHTNVMMAVCETFAVICLDCIDDVSERTAVENSLRNTGKEIIAISEDQVKLFAGNMLQVVGECDKRFLVMSSTAYQSLTDEQIAAITRHCDIVHSDIGTIETCGGGSARCMMAEVYLPKN